MIVFDPVDTTPEKFEYGVFSLKTHQMFSVHTMLEKLENATITGYFGNLWQLNHIIVDGDQGMTQW